MSRLSIAPVVYCKRCKKPLVVDAETYDDPQGDMLRIVLLAARDNALCDDCQNSRLYYVSQGRVQDWERGLP